MDLALRALALVLVAYVAGVGLLFLAQRSFLYFPTTSHPDRLAAGLGAMAEVQLKTSDGLDNLAWHGEPTGARPTVVYFHGNGGSIQHRGFKVRPFLDRGYGVLLVEYRGYGGNAGRPTEAGLFEDARAALRFLGERGTTASEVVLYGESLGTGVATALAHEAAVLGRPVKALILEAPFTSITDIAARQFPIVPVRLLLRDGFDNSSRIASVGCPLLILHGEQDRVVPVNHGKALFAAASEPKRLVLLPQGGHEDVHQAGGLAAALRFMAEEVGGTP